MRKVKKVLVWASPIENPSARFLQSYKEYDNQGRVIEECEYYDEDAVDSKSLIMYDEQGRVVEEIQLGLDEELTLKTVYHRNSDGKIENIVTHYADGSLTTKQHVYNDAEKAISIDELDEDGQLEGREFLRYNENGLVVERKLWDDENKLVEHVVNEYDATDLVNQKEYDGKGRLLSETRFELDENKRLLRRLTLNAERQILDRLVLDYDENGNLIEQRYGDHTLYRFYYNENGKLLKEQKVNYMGVVEYQKEYEYNSDDLVSRERELFDIKDFEYSFFD